MKNGKTELVFILDRSGSMAGLVSDTIGGFNSMIDSQKLTKGDCLVTTVLFDTRFTRLHDRVPLQDVKPLTREDYVPGGCTALLDAMGDTIRHVAHIHKYSRREDVPENVLHSIEFTESGLYAVGTLTRGELNYRMGEYSVAGDVYTLNGYGSVQFDNSNAGQVEIVVTQDGKPAETMPATFSRATGTDQLYRGWTIDKTRVTVRGWTTASADFKGCNLYEIAQFIRNNGHDAPDDIAPGLELRSISFTGTEKMFFAYSDGTGDASEFKYNGSSFTYRWDDDKMGFTFLPKQATVEYMDGKCILSISSDIQDSTTSVSVTFVLSPML